MEHGYAQTAERNFEVNQLKSIFNIIVALAIFLIPTSVLAHSGLKNSDPEANSTVTEDIPQQGGTSQVGFKSKDMNIETNRVASSNSQTDSNKINGFLILISFAVIAMFIVPGAVVFFLFRKRKK
jgi:hypothetical protein